MSIKLNHSTIESPGGVHLIDAPYVLTDIDTVIQQLQQEDARQKNAHNGIIIFKTKRTTTVIAILDAGSIINENATDGIICIQVLKGSVFVKTNVKEEPLIVNAGNLFFMHREFSYNIQAAEESFLLLLIEEG